MGWVQNLKEVKILNLNLAFRTDMKATCQGKKTVFLFFFFFPNPGVQPGSPASQAESLLCEPPKKP